MRRSTAGFSFCPLHSSLGDHGFLGNLNSWLRDEPDRSRLFPTDERPEGGVARGRSAHRRVGGARYGSAESYSREVGSAEPRYRQRPGCLRFITEPGEAISRCSIQAMPEQLL
jgi:hypothetical protein